MNNSFSTSFKVLAVVALLSNSYMGAMETVAAPAAPAVEPVAPVVVIPVVAAKKECPFTAKVCKAWNDTKTFALDKKAEIFAAAKDMKARGWSQWTDKEKAGVVIGGTVVAATAAYLVYKAYKSLTSPKAKAKVRNNRK